MNAIYSINKIKGEVCWLAVGGRGNGSMVTFHFGEKIERKQTPSSGKEMIHLSNKYKGEYCIFIKGCSWRLEVDGKVLVSWRDSEERISEYIKKIEGLSVADICLMNKANDLCLVFDDGYVLTLFCDQTDGVDSMENYAIRIPGEWLLFGPGSRISYEPADP